MKLSQLASITNGCLTGEDVEFSSFSLDSRTIGPDQLFVAIRGIHFDGHAFIDQAQQQGACALLVEHPVLTKLPTITVQDTRLALGQVARWHREQFSIPMIVLTGSCGKTTTKDMLFSVLSECGPTLASKRSFNNELGVPLTLLELTAQHQYAVLELGANHPGEINYLSQLVQPTVALVTNIGPAHLQGFGSLMGVAAAKFEIFSGLKKGGHAVINAQDPHMTSWSTQLAQPIVYFGDVKSGFFARDIVCHALGSQFVIHTPLGEIEVSLALPGEHNVSNAIACAACAIILDVPLQALKRGLEKIRSLSGRFTGCCGLNGSWIVDDTYNANPSSVAAALSVLAQDKRQRWFIFGGMCELGDYSDFYHAQIGQLARTYAIDRLFTCGPSAQITANAFGSNAQHFAQQDELIRFLKPRLSHNQIILIKGSRSARMEKVVEALRQL